MFDITNIIVFVFFFISSH